MAWSGAQLTGIVLGGGRSRRLGLSQSKLLIPIGGKMVLARVADTLGQFCSELVLVVRPDQDDGVPDLGIALGMHVVADTETNSGPIAGIHAGLTVSTTMLSFVIAGDHPFLSSSLVQAMAAAAAAAGSDPSPAVIPCSEGALHPLHAVYPREPWLRYLARLMTDGETSPRSAIELAISTGYPPVTIFTDDELEQADPRHLSLMDIDTTEHLSTARQIVESRKSMPPRR